MADSVCFIYHVQKADDMPFDRWYAYMVCTMMVMGFWATHCISKTQGKSLLVPKNMMGNHNFENLMLLA